MTHDASLSILDHDGPIEAPHHIILNGMAYWLDGETLTFATWDDPMPWEDGIGVECDPELIAFDAIVALLHASDPRPVRFMPKLIGTIDKGIDGHDAYSLLTVNPEGPAPLLGNVEHAFHAAVYDAGNGPGTRFTRTTYVIPVPGDAYKFIGVAQVRWDV